MQELDITSASNSSVAAIDSALWAARGGDITAYAQNKGFTVDHWPDPPAPQTAERNLYTMADATVWIDTTAQYSDSAKRPIKTMTAPASGFPWGPVVAVGSLVVAGAALAAGWTYSRRRVRAKRGSVARRRRDREASQESRGGR